MKSRRAVLFAACASIAVLGVAPAAHAGTQAVTGTTLGNSISVGTIGAATFGTALGASGTVSDTGLGTVPIVAIGPWTMTATGGGTTGHEGHLALQSGQSATCPTSTATLTNALDVYPSATLGNFTPATYNSAALSSTNTEPLGASAITLGTGTGSNTVTVNYKQVSSSSDQLQAGCIYTETTTLTVS
jgi:hypothetical protein